MNTDHVTRLLDDMEEYYEHFEHYPLYLLGWSLNSRSLSAEQKHALARRAYDGFTSRHPTKVVWSRWPIDLGTVWQLEPDTELDFDLDPDQSVDVPLQVLVPADHAVST
jgi:hypothetical protein